MAANRGGQANEAGSVHRRSLAAFIACYGLLGRAVPGLERGTGSPPVYIEFETDQPTDDFTVRFADGSSAYVSAKRECGNDDNFRDTVDQWFDQAPELRPGDLLVLAVGRAKGAIVGLNEGLDKRRRRIGARSAAAKDALEAFDEACKGKNTTVRRTVGEHAVLLRVDAAESPAPQYEVARAAIGGRLVPDEQAAAAISALSTAFHDQAAAATGSDLDQWLKILDAAAITVFADAEGPKGARRRAEQEALAAYNAELVRTRGRVDLTLLADDIPRLTVNDLVDGIHAETALDGSRAEKVPLMALARGWERFVLVGLPGAGKSTAARELASACACDLEAPQPILVELRALVRDHGSGDVRTHDLLHNAARTVSLEQRPSLEAAFDFALRTGNALLILDGLDEVEPHAAQLAEALANELRQLPPGVGAVLTTRASGSRAATHLNLPVARLTRPKDLDKTLTALLHHIANQRVDATETGDWIRARQDWLAEERRSISSLLEVPLLAVILVLMLADHDPAGLPANPARLLHDAVIDSARRWETNRKAWPTRPTSSIHALTQPMLTESFATIGQFLLREPQATKADVLNEVTQLFTSDRWQRPPADAEALADEAVHFWDDVMAVFVFDANGQSIPRSRVFLEVAAAIRATSADDQYLRQWVADALSNPAERSALDLAAQLDDRVLDAALALCDTSAQATRFLARTAVVEGTVLGDERTRVLAAALREEALTAARTANDTEPVATGPGASGAGDHDAPRTSDNIARRASRDALHGGDRAVDGLIWPPIAMLCLLPMPERARDEALHGLLELDALHDEQRVLGDGLIALTRSTGRSLQQGEIQAVRAALLTPLPAKKEPRHEDGVLHIETGPPPRLGLAALAEAAAHRLDELDPESATRINAIASKCSWGRGRRILTALTQHKADTSDFFGESFRSALAGIADIADTLGPRPEVHMLKQLIALDPDATPANGPASWRMKELRHLIATAGWHSISLPDFNTAFFDETELLRGWLTALCQHANADPTLIASQARRAADEVELAELVDDLLAIPPVADNEPCSGPGTLTTRQIADLEQAASAKSGWIREGAERLLAPHAGNPSPRGV